MNNIKIHFVSMNIIKIHFSLMKVFEYGMLELENV